MIGPFPLYGGSVVVCEVCSRPVLNAQYEFHLKSHLQGNSAARKENKARSMETTAQVYKRLTSSDERERLSAEADLVYQENGKGGYIGSEQLMKLFRHEYEMAHGVKHD